MRKNAFNLILAVTLVLFFFSSQMSLHARPFEVNNVESTIEFLSSDKFKGRLSGSSENGEVAEYIKSSFNNTGLKPLSSDFFESFNVKYPSHLKEMPLLQVKSGNKVVKEYTYGSDYKEDMLNFKSNTVSFNKHDKTYFEKGIIQVAQNDDLFIFYVPENNKIGFRSSFSSESNASMFITISSKTYDELKSYVEKGLTVYCHAPFSVRETSVDNVVGYIEGTNPKLPPVVISAHFDHVGSDSQDNIYNGALDNASGTAFMLEMSRYLKSLGQPKRTMIFTAFNAEEFGCIGSKEFALKHIDELNGAQVFNFDMIGGSYQVPLCIMGGSKDTRSTPLIKYAADLCKNKHVDFNYLFEDSSDHEFFRKQNIQAITFIDNDMSKIHTLADKSSQIDARSIKRCYAVASEAIIKEAFDDSYLKLYYKEISNCSLGMLAFLVAAGSLAKKLSR